MAYYITTPPLGKPGQRATKENWHQLNFPAKILHSQLRHSHHENFLTIVGESASKTMVTVLAPMTQVAIMWNHHVSTWWYLCFWWERRNMGWWMLFSSRGGKRCLQSWGCTIHLKQIGVISNYFMLRGLYSSCCGQKKLQLPANQALTPPLTIPEQKLQLSQRSRSMISSPVASATPFSESRHEKNKILFWMTESWKKWHLKSWPKNGLAILDNTMILCIYKIYIMYI